MKNIYSKRLSIVLGLLLLAIICVGKHIEQSIRQENANNRLLTAIQHRDIAVTLTSLQNGANPNARTERHTSLWQSVLNNIFDHQRTSTGEEISQPAILLVISPADRMQLQSSQTDEQKATATTLYRLLLEKGADPNATDIFGETALHVACQYGLHDTVKLLLAKGANVHVRDKLGAMALTYAMGDSYLVQLLLERGADPNVRYDGLPNRSDIEPPKNTTPLIHAARIDDCDSMKALLAAGADINAKDAEGYTALMWAVSYNYPEIVQLLLTDGADVNINNNRGESVLQIAEHIPLPDIVHLLKRRSTKR